MPMWRRPTRSFRGTTSTDAFVLSQLDRLLDGRCMPAGDERPCRLPRGLGHHLLPAGQADPPPLRHPAGQQEVADGVDRPGAPGGACLDGLGQASGRPGRLGLVPDRVRRRRRREVGRPEHRVRPRGEHRQCRLLPGAGRGAGLPQLRHHGRSPRPDRKPLRDLLAALPDPQLAQRGRQRQRRHLLLSCGGLLARPAGCDGRERPEELQVLRRGPAGPPGDPVARTTRAGSTGAFRPPTGRTRGRTPTSASPSTPA